MNPSPDVPSDECRRPGCRRADCDRPRHRPTRPSGFLPWVRLSTGVLIQVVLGVFFGD